MNFQSQRPYVDVCLDYALSYSQAELSDAFSETVNRICKRPENSQYANGKPILIQHGPFETEASPTNVKDGLWSFFGNRPTFIWSRSTFADYYLKLKEELFQSYVPFTKFSEASFQDAMRLRVYQDSMNIIAGRNLDGKTTRSYSLLQKALWHLKKNARPEL